MLLPVLSYKDVSVKEFVSFWSSQYFFPAEHLYLKNIYGPLTRDSILSLFEWKNGGRLSKRKKESVLKNYVCRSPLPNTTDKPELKKFLLKPGGAIWRIFWLHCNFPDEFPIYDQHVHRAMAKIKGWKHVEIPKTNQVKIASYLESYLPFWQIFSKCDQRKADRAVWAYGKYLKLETRLNAEAKPRVIS